MERLEASTLRAVGRLWRSTGRVFEAQFDGTSMLPSIAPGAALRVDCGADVEPGCVVVYVRENRVVVHRLIAMLQGERLWTRGDANFLPDPVVSGDQLIGRVVAAQRGEVWAPIPPPPQRPFLVRAAAIPVMSAPARPLLNLMWTVRWFGARSLLALLRVLRLRPRTTR